jgi:hypothetical protein
MIDNAMVVLTYIPPDVALSPQCGFASSLAGNLLGEDAQWRKLEVIREVAAQVWT